MFSLKKRFIVCVVFVMMLVATVLPAAAQDNGSTPAPSPISITINLGWLGGSNGGIVIALSLPVRCGNNC